MKNMKILIAVNEFFGALGTARGGYGFLARKILPAALGIPLENLTVCLGKGKFHFKKEQYFSEEGIEIIRLPRIGSFAKMLLNRYDLIISIEATVLQIIKLAGGGHPLRTPILFWIQDPRPQSDWDEINSVSLAKEKSYYSEYSNQLVTRCFSKGNLFFASQAESLIPKARELYNLPSNLKIPFLPNPVPFKPISLWNKKKNNSIIFVGRLDSVKRGWLFCEIAKRLPNHKFYIMGASTNADEANKNKILSNYSNLPNLTFLGHLDGTEKEKYLIQSKILVNTSIHEALPVSFLEAFLYGITVISNQNPDGLVSKYGKYVGKSHGDGWDDVDKFVSAIEEVFTDEESRQQQAKKAYDYVTKVHSNEYFRSKLSEILSTLRIQI